MPTLRRDDAKPRLTVQTRFDHHKNQGFILTYCIMAVSFRQGTPAGLSAMQAQASVYTL